MTGVQTFALPFLVFKGRPVRQQRDVELCKSLLGKALARGDSRGRRTPGIARPGQLAGNVVDPVLAAVDAERDGHRAGRQLEQRARHRGLRSEEHTSELQSLMRISYAVFCLKKTKKNVKTSIKSHKII